MHDTPVLAIYPFPRVAALGKRNTRRFQPLTLALERGGCCHCAHILPICRTGFSGGVVRRISSAVHFVNVTSWSLLPLTALFRGFGAEYSGSRFQFGCP